MRYMASSHRKREIHSKSVLVSLLRILSYNQLRPSAFLERSPDKTNLVEKELSLH